MVKLYVSTDGNAKLNASPENNNSELILDGEDSVGTQKLTIEQETEILKKIYTSLDKTKLNKIIFINFPLHSRLFVLSEIEKFIEEGNNKISIEYKGNFHPSEEEDEKLFKLEPKLTEIKLSQAAKTLTQKSSYNLAKWIENFKLENILVTEDQTRNIVNGLISNRKLKSIHFINCNFTQMCLEHLVKQYKQLNPLNILSLTSINLSGNHIESAKSLLELIDGNISNESQWYKDDLNENKWSKQGLDILDLSANNLVDGQEFINFFEHSNNIKKVNLNGNNFITDDVINIIHAFVTGKDQGYVQTLQLSFIKSIKDILSDVIKIINDLFENIENKKLYLVFNDDKKDIEKITKQLIIHSNIVLAASAQPKSNTGPKPSVDIRHIQPLRNMTQGENGYEYYMYWLRNLNLVYGSKQPHKRILVEGNQIHEYLKLLERAIRFSFENTDKLNDETNMVSVNIGFVVSDRNRENERTQRHHGRKFVTFAVSADSLLFTTDQNSEYRKYYDVYESAKKTGKDIFEQNNLKFEAADDDLKVCIENQQINNHDPKEESFSSSETDEIDNQIKEPKNKTTFTNQAFNSNKNNQAQTIQSLVEITQKISNLHKEADQETKNILSKFNKKAPDEIKILINSLYAIATKAMMKKFYERQLTKETDDYCFSGNQDRYKSDSNHHSEAALYLALHDRSTLLNIITKLKEYLLITRNDKNHGFKVYAVVLDIFSTRILCWDCAELTLGLQNSIQPEGFLSQLSSLLKEDGFKLSQHHALRMVTRVTADAKGERKKVEASHYDNGKTQLGEKPDIKNLNNQAIINKFTKNLSFFNENHRKGRGRSSKGEDHLSRRSIFFSGDTGTKNREARLSEMRIYELAQQAKNVAEYTKRLSDANENNVPNFSKK